MSLNLLILFCVKFVYNTKGEITILDKESYYLKVVQAYSELHPVSVAEGQDLLNVLTVIFSDVNMDTSKMEISTQVAPNEIIVKNFLGIKKLSGKKASTLRCYNHQINFFIRSTGLDVTQVTTNDIRRFLLWYEGTGVTDTSVDNMRRVLNLFFQFMEDEQYIQHSPCRRISKIKCDKPMKHFFTDMEMEIIRDACVTKRELAMVDFLQSTGVRVTELSNILLTDVDWETNTVLIHGKGGKDRYVYMNAKACKHVREYLADRPYSPYLFCGQIKPHNQLRKDSINAALNRLGHRAGLKRLTVHCFRRWFANDLNKKSVDVRIIQQLLGHESFETTQGYYLQDDIEKAKQIHRIYAN